MKAMLSRAPGGPDTLELTELDTPSPESGEVLVRVRAAGVNFADTLVIRDLYQVKPPRPFAPGGEIAGVVERVGAGVEEVQPGDRVLALPGHGGFATHVVVRSAVPIPDAMPFEDAAALCYAYGTSHHALKDRARLQPGECLFVLGAASGVGTAAIELGKAVGARVVAGVSTEEKADFARQVGADDVLVYPRRLDGSREAGKALSAEIKALAKAGGSDGVDVVYDAVGGNYAEPALRALSWNGRFLVVGFPAGIPAIPLNLTLVKGCQIVGVFWGAHVAREPDRHAENMADLFRLYGEGRIKPRISARFRLDEAPAALESLTSRELQGKAVLVMDD